MLGDFDESSKLLSLPIGEHIKDEHIEYVLTHEFCHFNRKEEKSNTASNHCNPCNNLLFFSHISKKINSLLNLID